MSNFVGRSGIIKIGGTVIGSVVSFSLTLIGDQVESTLLGDEWRAVLPTLKSWNGSVNLYFDGSNLTQALILPNALLTFELLPEGETQGNYLATGSAYISNIEQGNDGEAVVNRDVTFEGTGELVISTVV